MFFKLLLNFKLTAESNFQWVILITSIYASHALLCSSNETLSYFQHRRKPTVGPASQTDRGFLMMYQQLLACLLAHWTCNLDLKGKVHLPELRIIWSVFQIQDHIYAIRNNALTSIKSLSVKTYVRKPWDYFISA